VVRLPAAIAAALEDEARARAPEEACGVLGGDAAGARFTSWHPLANRARSAVFFSIGPEVMDVIDGIEAVGDRMLAIWHSHTGSPAAPSRTDREFAAGWGPDVLWLLTSLLPGERTPRLWRIDGVTAAELDLVVSPGA
jgi:proteasome lid subunit RPN8/RPN11